MRRFTVLLSFLVIILLGAVACQQQAASPPPPPPPAEPPPTVATVTGVVSLPPGSPGSLSNMVCSLYTSLDAWDLNSPSYFGAVEGAGASVRYNLTNVNPGSYYLDCWLDRDDSGDWSFGDFVAIHGQVIAGQPRLTPIPVSAGQLIEIDLLAFVF